MEVTPEPTTIAEQLSRQVGVAYATGTKKYHDSGSVVFEVHTQVRPELTETVKEILEGHGYSTHVAETDHFDDRMIVEGEEQV